MVWLLFPMDSGLATVLSLRSSLASESCFRPRLCLKAESCLGVMLHQQNHLRTQRARERGLICTQTYITCIGTDLYTRV